MNADDAVLTGLERDALTELVNIGVSRAAASLRRMVGDQVLLSVPAVEIVTRLAAATLISEREPDRLVAVRQTFSGAFAGRALLIFPQAHSLDLVRAVAGEHMSAESAADMEQEALAETGNVILNGCLGSMANMLHQTLTMSLPEILRGDGATLFETLPTDRPAPAADPDVLAASGPVLFLYINFVVRRQDIRGYIAMLMDLPSLQILKALVNEFIASVMEDDAAAGPQAENAGEPECPPA
jgi:chemotaxis protein CheC